MTLYVDSSAWLAILLGEPTETAVRDALSRTTARVTSDLAIVEVSRGLRRAGLEPALAIRHLRQVSAVMPIGPEVLAVAGGPLPDLYVRSLDALHLGSASILSRDHARVAVVTLDGRMRQAALALGFPVLP